MPSGRGLVVFGSGLAMWVAARIVGSGGMETVGIGLVALPFLAGVFVRWGRTRLRVRRRLSDVRVPPGTRVSVGLDVENEASVPSPFLLIEDQLPASLGRPARLVLSGLPAHGSQQVTYTLLPQTRGRYRLGPLTVDVSDPFALTHQRLEFDEHDDLLVTPEIEDLMAAPDSGFGPSWGATRARQLFRTGEEYHTMRQYQFGDDLRRIHWPSVARTGDLMIRQDESSRRASGLVFLDNRGHSLGQSHSPAFERAVSVAATLGVLLAQRGFALRLGTAETPPATVSEDRFLDALAGISHASARSVGPSLAHLRTGASPDTSLVYVAAPPAPGELTSLIRAGAGFGPKLVVLVHPVDPRRLPTGQAAQLEGRATQATLAFAQGGLGLHRLDPVDPLEGTMAHTQGPSARTQRLIAGVATVLVAAASAVALGRVFEGNGPTLRLLVAGVASAVLATLLERRNLVLSTIASAAGLAVAIGLLVFPQTTWFGLPTAETLRAVLDATSLIGEQARAQIAPSLPLAPLMLAGLAGVWAAVFAAHSLAFRAGSPLLALVPPVALVGFADSVLEDVVRPVFGLLFLVAATAMLFADGLRRVQGWGPVWVGPGRASKLDVAAGRGARRVAAAAVMVAAIAPIALPGFGSRGVIDFSTVDDDRVRIDPLVSVQASLQRDEVATVFEVEADLGRYWRMVALPNFDGRIWSPDPSPATLPVQPGAVLVTNTPASLSTETTEVSFTTTSELALPWLPLPYPPRSADAPLEGMRWEPEGGSIALEGGVGPGVTYMAVADVVQPTPDQLRAEPIAATEDTVRYTATPEDLPREIAALADRWSEGAPTVYDAIIAIQDRFIDPRWGFSYDADVAGSSSDRAMVEFLTRTRVGFCQQFSSAMAVMLRTLGIPSRLAVGFTPGQVDDSTDRLTVTTENAHSWVEVLFPSFGWVPFEPTPGRQNVTAYPYTDPTSAEACPDGDASCGPGGSRGPGTSSGAEGQFLTAAERESVRVGGLGARGIRGSGAVFGSAGVPVDPGPFTARNAVAAAVVALAVVVALVPLWHGWRRRLRLRRAGPGPRSMILATYDVFTERAAELGHPRSPGQTLEEYRRGVEASRSPGGSSGGPPGNGDLDRLTRLATDAAYAERNPGRDDVVEARRASEAVVRQMRRNASLTQRFAGPYRQR